MNATSSIRRISAGIATGLVAIPSLVVAAQAPAVAETAQNPNGTPSESPAEAVRTASDAEAASSPGVTLSAKASGQDCAEVKCVALTFDDGPGQYTDELLDTLAEHDAQATFYVLGSLVDEFPEAVERMAAEGHEVGSHSWQHDDLADLSPDEIREDLSRTGEAIREATGSEPTTMRPPYGSLDEAARSTIDQPMVLWDVDTLDWQSRDADAAAEKALQSATPGSVVLFHGIYESSVDAIPEVLEELSEDDYHFVTVTDLFGADELEPGDAYTDARPTE